MAGVGSGLVNPALASTAVGVVPHRAAGMASGINNTFRQVGVATGIAVFGTLLAARVGHRPLAEVPRAAFVSGLNEILVVSGIGALLAAVAALALIRSRDFVAYSQPAAPSTAPPTSAPHPLAPARPE